MVRVAINGFGRIGRRVFRLLLSHPKIQIVAINDLADTKTLAHLLKYDSIHGTLKRTVSSDDKHISIDKKTIPVLNKIHPKDLNWNPYDVDIVIESTGKFKSKSELIHHINNGASKVILSVPPTDEDLKTVVLGVNDDLLQSDDLIISNASFLFLGFPRAVFLCHTIVSDVISKSFFFKFLINGDDFFLAK